MNRIPHDFYPTPVALTRAMLYYIPRDLGAVFDPCVGDGQMLESLPAAKTLSNDINPHPNYEPHYRGDAKSRELWEWLNLRHNIDWVITNPPFKHAAEIAENALIFSHKGVALLLPITFLEPCKGRRRLLEDWSDHLKYVIPINPRPRFRSDTKGTAPATVAWFVWDHHFSWDELDLACPFQFIIDWDKA